MRKRDSRGSPQAETDVPQRLNVPDLAKPPGYTRVVVASGARVVMTVSAVPSTPLETSSERVKSVLRRGKSWTP